MSNSGFLAGVAQIKTTPVLGTRINGDFITHYANYIHDDLFAKAFVFQKDTVQAAMVVVDICIMQKDFLDGVRQQIALKTNIPFENIMVSSTHTHAAGSVADVHLGSMDPAYAKILPGFIVDSVMKAKEKLRPAQIAFGSINVPDHVLCRRYEMSADFKAVNPVTNGLDQVKTNPIGAEQFILKPTATPDPELGYLAIKGLDGEWIGVLANYSLHYVGDWDNGTISADYFGVFASGLTQMLGINSSDFICSMSNGTSGDVNIWDFKNPDRYPKGKLEKSQLIGLDLADRVYNSIANLEWQRDPTLLVKYEEVPVDVIKPGAKELIGAQQTVSQARYEHMTFDHQGALGELYAREQVLLNEFPVQLMMPIQGFQIGDGLIGSLAGEFFSETGLFLKGNVNTSHYFTITMANGNLGYVPPTHEIIKGGYETWRCRYSCLSPGSEEMVRNSLLALLKSF